MPEEETRESDGLPDALLLKNSLDSLRLLVNELVDAMQGEEGIKYNHLVRSMKNLHAKHELMLTEMARMDAEIIRAHERLDLARDYLRKLKNKVVDNDDQKA